MRIADNDRLFRHRRADAVRNDTVIREVAAADDISRTAGEIAQCPSAKKDFL